MRYYEPGRRYHVANSAGFIRAFDTLAEAREYARYESGAGWLGTCWVVRR